MILSEVEFALGSFIILVVSKVKGLRNFFIFLPSYRWHVVLDVQQRTESSGEVTCVPPSIPSARL